ncbi:electron transfer flavoprotein beta subunit [Anseongella ginsenosidimutans]|uniref:Electron transfer flavoprotein beta subunit n=1 Tax=Anseongella ginsenosidimutans TaxID=496056 RepID=A0A4R3KTF3_9SPHI|nr:electron transfer flavoprotein subunit beta/FixA family protein [Anseongella ginsenosidimutans]QEC53345.1 electron transfer flavoprotein subunit beta/FixA family protein [Anseongella ginsenosidimutans]TCS88230.1 electron transfer flavoprotein beta subunit [Anseongella ginsenosidimutans]
MKILVCISVVPDTTTKITFTDNNTEFNSSGVQFIINPYDEIALARALELTEGGKGSVTVIHVGTAAAEPVIRKALAMGADEAIRVNAAPRDAFFVSRQIASVAGKELFDMILCGRESIDYNGGQVGAMIGERLNIPSVSIVKKIDLEENKALLEREIEGGKEIVETALPFVASCSEGVAEPRIPSMRGIMTARTKPLKTVEAEDAPQLQRILSFEVPPPRGSVKMIDAADAGKLIDLLHEEAKVI